MPPAHDTQQDKSNPPECGPRASVTDERKRRILLQLQSLRDRFATKSRKHYKSDHAYRRQQRRAQELIDELESELSILNCPGEYGELPLAVIADELGLTYIQVKSLVSLGEIEVSGKTAHERVSRKELERITSLGVKELLRASEQLSAGIFEDAISFFQSGELALAERASTRLNARESWQGVYAPACLIAVELLRGELEDALSSMRCVNEELDPFQRILVLEHLRQLLRRMRLDEDGARRLCEQFLIIADAVSAGADTPNRASTKKLQEKQDNLMQQSMYLAAAVQLELRKHQFGHRHRIFDSVIEKHQQEFHSFVRDAIYTALYAEVTYEEFIASRAYVDTIRLSLPKRFQPAQLLKSFRKNR